MLTDIFHSPITNIPCLLVILTIVLILIVPKKMVINQVQLMVLNITLPQDLRRRTYDSPPTCCSCCSPMRQQRSHQQLQRTFKNCIPTRAYLLFALKHVVVEIVSMLLEKVVARCNISEHVMRSLYFKMNTTRILKVLQILTQKFFLSKKTLERTFAFVLYSFQALSCK